VVEPGAALVFGVVLTLLALSVLILASHSLLPAFLVLLTTFLYVLVYTPLKRRTWLNTTIGAIPGALPIMCGWASATGELDFTAWVLFALMFAWQHPHFYAIAWIHKEDYRKAGFKMLSVVDTSGHRLFIQVILYAFFLTAISLVPFIMGKTGVLYALAALILGLHGVWESIQFIRHADIPSARRLLRSTLVYLPALGLAVLLDILFPVSLAALSA
jgi:protoheme IX farnesyltransferase